MSLEPKRKYLAKQTLTNKYSEFKSTYHLLIAFCCYMELKKDCAVGISQYAYFSAT
jgi:hypothetical protein